MFQRKDVRKFRSILVALAITLAANFAISVVANASSPQAYDQKSPVGRIDAQGRET